MKVKNLFRSLVVVALVVPFLFGLTACGKSKTDYSTVKAEDAYAEMIKKPTEAPTHTKQTITVNTREQEFDSVETTKTVIGYDKTEVGTDKKPANDYFMAVYKDGKLTNQQFTAKTKVETTEVKNVFTYTFTPADPEVEDSKDTETYGVEVYSDAKLTAALTAFGAVQTANDLDGIMSFVPSEGTKFEDFKKGLEANFEDYLSEDAKINYEGRKYNDGSYALAIEITDTRDGLTSTMKVVVGMKDGEIVRLSSTSTRTYKGNVLGDSSAEFVIVEDYVTNGYVGDPVEYAQKYLEQQQAKA